MNIALIGDIVGKPGRDIIGKYLPKIREEYKIDLVVANYENASHGFGLTRKNCDELLGHGIDVMTGGNHSWDKREIFELYRTHPLIRPINLPDVGAGEGLIMLNVLGFDVAILNVMGNYTMPMTDNPFIKIDKAVEELKVKGIKHIIIDVHAEATSEKLTMMHILKDRVSALFGTHTHVGTDDLMVVNGCCYVTDIGLSGCRDGVIGMDKKIPIQRSMTALGGHFDISKKCQSIFQLIILEVNDNGRAISSQKLKIYSSGKVVKMDGLCENY